MSAVRNRKLQSERSNSFSSSNSDIMTTPSGAARLNATKKGYELETTE
jgi:hypothetical protein